MKRLAAAAAHIGITLVCLLVGGYGGASAAAVTFPFSGNIYFETSSTKNQYIYIPVTGVLSYDPSLLTETYSAPDRTNVYITGATGDGVSFTLNAGGLPTFSISPPAFYPSWATLSGGELNFSLNSRFYPTSPTSPPPGTVFGFVTLYPLTYAGPFFYSLPATSIPNPQNVGIGGGVGVNGQGYDFTGTGAAIATDQYASPCVNDGLSGGVTCAGSASQVSQPTDVDLTKTSTPNLVVGAGGGTGTLAVGPATLTASSITLGGENEGDAIVQSGGTIKTGSLTIGNTTVNGSLSVQSGGSVNAQSVVLGNTAASINLASGSSLQIGPLAPSGHGMVLNGGSLEYDVSNSAGPLITASGGIQPLHGTITMRPNDPSTFAPTPGTNYPLLQTPAGGLKGFLTGYTPPSNPIPGYLAVAFGGTSIQSPFLTDTVTQLANGKFAGQSNYLVPVVQNSSLLSDNTIGLTYLPVRASLSTDQEYLIAKLAADSGVTKIQINSTDRTIGEQAFEMTRNLIKAFQAADAGSTTSGVPTPGAAQREFYELLLGDGPATGGSYQALIDSTSPTSVFATTFLSYDASSRTFSVNEGINPNIIPSSFIQTAVNDILRAETITGKSISHHVDNNMVQAVDIQIGSGNTDLNYGSTANQFKTQATELLGDGLSRVLCPAALGCAVHEGSANVFHLELDNSQVDPFAGMTPQAVSPVNSSNSLYAYQFDANADTPYALDPSPASGYVFQESPDSTLFSSILLPSGSLPNGFYEVDVNSGFGWEFAADLAPGERIFFCFPKMNSGSRGSI
jgi:hypothetical protein